MARKRRKTKAVPVKAVANGFWDYLLKPLLVGGWRYLVRPAAGRGWKGVQWSWEYATEPDTRPAKNEVVRAKVEGRARWVRPVDEPRKRRKPRRGTYHCRRCGRTAHYVAGTGSTHDCAPREATQPRHPGYDDKPAKKRTRTKPGPPPRRRRERPVPPAPTPTRGARIVRAGTAAERFAYLATADPQNVEEFESLVHDLRMGFHALAGELYNLAEALDLDPKITGLFSKLGDDVAELAEPARDIRAKFRWVYDAYLQAAESGVKRPKDPKFFDPAA